MPQSIPFAVQGYYLDKSIGQGNAGTVYRATRKSPNSNSTDSQRYAVKVISRSKVRDPVRREVAIHMRLRHPNIIRLHRVIPTVHPTQLSSNSTPSTPQRRHSHHITSPAPASLALVMEYASAGDMFTEVASAGCLSPRVVRTRLRDITAALQYLHDNRYVHLDVKLENVVITNSSSAKLTDFGCVRDMDANHDSSNLTALGGTVQYLPPEVVESSKAAPVPSSDAWSLGVLTYTALVGNYPFSPTASDSASDNDEATRHRIVNCPPHRIPSSMQLPSDLRRIVFGLLEKDPKKRMTIPQVIAGLQRSTALPFHRTAPAVEARKSSQHAKCDCPVKRTPSPSGTADADFTICNCGGEQTVEQALDVVDSIQRHRLRATRDVQRYLSDFDAPSATTRRHSSSRGEGDGRRTRNSNARH